ncbi:MAG: SIR2 family protein [Methanosarcina barkeri]|nr:SIR2 family protein [Methanosarcina sp. ERenArc_MAG2]
MYLHGLLPDSFDETELNRLVFTSGDFGLAYLTERWASRFVTELFRHYTVCFVGYGINDPVLRYMMDAFAADELLGETRPEAFAFACYYNEEREKAKIEWETKGVIPLLYEVPAGTHDHSALHRTLKEWADTYHDGVQGKEMIISQHASTPPLTSSRTDYAVCRILWALTDDLAAKHFADLNPVPPLEWLEPLSEKQFEHRDLSHFGVAANSTEDKDLRFSIFHRPAPYTRSPWMCIVDNGTQNSHLDPVMFHLSRWLTRHLDDPKLILWLARYGDSLHNKFIRQISDRLDYLDRLAADRKKEEINRIIADAPNAIPGPPMRTLWRLFMTGRIKLKQSGHSDFYDLNHCIKLIIREGMTPSLRIKLRENLAPRVALRAPFHLVDNTHVPSKPTRIRDLVNWDLVLHSNDVHSLIDDWSKNQNYQEVLPDFLQDFTLLLRDALDLARELGDANDRYDLSYIEQPSISQHSQNSNFHDWTALIKFTRDAWLATAQSDSTKARHAAEGWWQQSYPVFKRLALFAASHDEVISHRQALDWLLGDKCWWLWAVETQREAMRLLVVLAPKMISSDVFELEQAILVGPPHEMFGENLEDVDWKHIVNQMVWLRLEKFQVAGGSGVS